jgi:hypothetical protein
MAWSVPRLSTFTLLGIVFLGDDIRGALELRVRMPGHHEEWGRI